MSWWAQDGLLIYLTEDEAKHAIGALRTGWGFKFGMGHMGRGLYSPTWDRQMGEWTDERRPGSFEYERMFAVNPSIADYLPHLRPIDDAPRIGKVRVRKS